MRPVLAGTGDRQSPSLHVTGAIRHPGHHRLSKLRRAPLSVVASQDRIEPALGNGGLGLLPRTIAPRAGGAAIPEATDLHGHEIEGGAAARAGTRRRYVLSHGVPEPSGRDPCDGPLDRTLSTSTRHDQSNTRPIVVLVAAALASFASCDPRSFSSDPPPVHCTEPGAQCELPGGPLGVCERSPCPSGVTPPCFRCTPQH